MHACTTDRIFVCLGTLKILLWDGRSGSPTSQKSSVYHIGDVRPALVINMPGIWRAVRNTTSEPAMLINVVDKAYAYGHPDHYRLAAESQQIPIAI